MGTVLGYRTGFPSLIELGKGVRKEVIILEDKENNTPKNEEQEDNEQKPKPSIGPNKDFYYVW